MIEESFTLRDDLARERTVMANERTLLAYGRTALGLLGLAVIIFKFSDAEVALPAGLLMLIVAGAVMSWGVRSYRLAHARISGEMEPPGTEVLALVETE